LGFPWLNKNDWDISFRKTQKHAILSLTFILEQESYELSLQKLPNKDFQKTQLSVPMVPKYERDHLFR
jgi:hypothetical protein